MSANPGPGGQTSYLDYGHGGEPVIRQALAPSSRATATLRNVAAEAGYMHRGAIRAAPSWIADDAVLLELFEAELADRKRDPFDRDHRGIDAARKKAIECLT